MPKQKDLKRIVRSRMTKTGESYTAARLQVLRKKEPVPDYAETAGMSDDAVKKATGRVWAEWVAALDAVRASEKPHREIAEYVHSLGVPDWWSQMLTVGYERIRGLRARGQRRDGGWRASKSRTFSVPVAKLYSAFARPKLRQQWLPVKIKVRTAKANKTMRITWDDDTRVELNFTARGKDKSAVAVEHQKLSDQAAAKSMKSWGSDRLDALSEILS